MLQELCHAIAVDIVPGALALVVVVAWWYLAAVGNPNTPSFEAVAVAVVSFYFGGKVAKNGSATDAATSS